jgi:Capsule polysaccharide biosynthesis protein
MRLLFTTRERVETEFYGRVGAELAARGHEVSHVAYSHRGAAALRRAQPQIRTYCLTDLMRDLGPYDRDAEAARIERRYMIPEAPTIRDVYRTDWPNEGKSEEESVERTVRHFLAYEQVFDEVDPQVAVPEVGSETLRTAAHLIGLERGCDVLFLFYTIFRDPLRLYRNTLHAPIVPEDQVRELSDSERAEIEEFVAEFKAREKPIRRYIEPTVSTGVAREWLSHLFVRLTSDRDNDYLAPRRMIRNRLRERTRAAVIPRLYEQLDTSRKFVYFPIHVTDDYKIKRVIPHCVDQAAIIEQVAEALPHGYDIVLKEHPMSIGRNPVSMLRRLTKRPNVYLVDPYTSSHQLIQQSAAVIVISSTVGLEALLYEHPVMTIGQPFYSGYGVTLDVDSFREITARTLEVLEFRPDRERILRFLHAAMRACYPGAPVLVDSSDENARKLGDSLDRAVRGQPPPGREQAAQPASARS